MSFKEIDIKDNNIKDERSCIIICNFNGKELQGIKNLANILGIKDQVIISYKNGESKVKDIIANEELKVDENGQKERTIIFNNISQLKLNIFMENLKKIKINNVLIATVTETSKDWSLNNLILNLLLERKAMKSGKSFEHA
ncbi:hypothetical protein JCM1393_23270 [Clostridium carnis]